jgi:hypothetical protein
VPDGGRLLYTPYLAWGAAVLPVIPALTLSAVLRLTLPAIPPALGLLLLLLLLTPLLLLRAAAALLPVALVKVVPEPTDALLECWPVLLVLELLHVAGMGTRA